MFEKLLSGNVKKKWLSNCAVLCFEVKTSAWTPKGSLAACLKAGDPSIVHQHVDPSVSEAGLVVQFWCNVCFYKLCFIFCWTSHRLKKHFLPLLDGVPQGLNSGNVSKVTDVEFWREPLCFKARHCCLLKRVFRIWKAKDYFSNYHIFLDLAASFISGSKVDVPVKLFTQSSHLGAARIDSGIRIQHRWIFGIIVLEMLTAPTDIRYINIKETGQI